MLAGRLRHRVTLQESHPGHERTGAPEGNWSDVTTVWGEVLELRGKEYINAAEAHAEVTTKIQIRYQPSITVKPSMRALANGHTYDILHVVDLMGRRRALELMCKEIVT